MNIENVVDIFSRLSSLSAEDILKFRFMCETAMYNVNSYIKKDIDMSDYDGRLCFAAAALAYYRYILWSLTESGNGEVKMGDFTVKANANQLDAAAKLCDGAFDAIKEITKDIGFVFERI